jgi:hypothetical protein
MELRERQKADGDFPQCSVGRGSPEIDPIAGSTLYNSWI